MTKNSAGTRSNRSVKAKKGHKERIQLRLVRMLHDGGSRHVQRYVPDDGLVRKSVYEMQGGDRKKSKHITSKFFLRTQGRD